MNCVTCQANCDMAGTHRVKTDCISYTPKAYPKPRTNADCIRSMTDEELSYFIAQQRFLAINSMADKLGVDTTVAYKKYQTILLDWLKQEATAE